MRPVECPECGRVLDTHNGRYITHSMWALGPECPLSRTVVSAAVWAEAPHVARAQTVLHLASLLRDEDPAWVWAHVERTEPAELRRMLMTALAAIPVDQRTRDQLFEWVKELPDPATTLNRLTERQAV